METCVSALGQMLRRLAEEKKVCIKGGSLLADMCAC
jgi:hypothetical protein